MSNAIRYDSLLIHYLAAELDERLRRRRLLGLALDPERRIAVLEFEDQALSWWLHPTAGWVTTGRAPISPEVVPLARRSQVARVRAPADERVLVFELRAAARRPGRAVEIVVELFGNQWNLIAVGPDERIVAALWKRRAGGRELRPGQLYEPAPAAGRKGADRPLSRGEWEELLGGLEPRERKRRLIAEVAYMSPRNAGAVLGEGSGSGDDLDTAYDRYLALASLPPPSPRLLELPNGVQPYPLPLPGVADAPHPTLLAAMAAAAGGGQVEAGGAGAIPLELLDRLRGRIRRLERRRERLGSQLSDAEAAAERFRYQGDLLMAQLHLVKKGMTEVELPDWEGGTVKLELDPALGPSENAAHLYDRARRAARAAERVPALVESVTTELDRLHSLLARAEAGEVEAAEVAAAVPEVEVGEAGRRGTGRHAAEPLPYRRYRTTGGLEVRVGRSSRANDDLTFRHSSPNDIWLHARDVAGAHVILRWGDAEANPPGRDLAEAANLASLHSRARTSGLVAVDWTRRKYVRKPRKSGPGQVAFERGRTIFVEPDPELEERMRVE